MRSLSVSQAAVQWATVCVCIYIIDFVAARVYSIPRSDYYNVCCCSRDADQDRFQWFLTLRPYLYLWRWTSWNVKVVQTDAIEIKARRLSARCSTKSRVIVVEWNASGDGHHSLRALSKINIIQMRALRLRWRKKEIGRRAFNPCSRDNQSKWPYKQMAEREKF